MALSFSDDALHALFPFSLMTDAKGLIEWVGPSLRKVGESQGMSFHVGDPWTTALRLERPEVMGLEAARVSELKGQLLVLGLQSPNGGESRGQSGGQSGGESRGQSHNTGPVETPRKVSKVSQDSEVSVRFRGQVVPLLAGSESWLFALSPAVSEAVEFSKLGLSYADFPAGDPVFDFLMLLQSERRAHARSQESVRKLVWDYRVSTVLHDLATTAAERAAQNRGWIETVAHVISQVCQKLEWDFGHLWLVDERAGEGGLPVLGALRSSGASFCSDPAGFGPFMQVTSKMSIVPGQGLPGRVWKSGELSWGLDFGQDSDFTRAPLLPKGGPWCGLAVPIRKSGVTVGVLEFYSCRMMQAFRDSRETERMVQFFETLTTQIGLQIEREALVEREREQDALLLASSNLSALGEMAAGISHEINNPLTAIVLGASQAQEVIAREVVDRGMVAKILERIQRSADRIQKIVQGMRTLARDGTGDPFVKYPVPQLMEDTLAICQARFRSGNVKLEVEYGEPADGQSGESGSCEVICRPVQICQVLLNLLNNAYDAIQGTPNAWVKIACGPDGDFARIEIVDSGPGISDELAQKIMKPFFTTKAVGKGTGLGLSISRSIIASHKGTLELDSSRPNTTFVLRVPRG